MAYAAAAGDDGRCATCLAAPPPFGQARAALRYDDISKRLILPFKYADRTEAARGLAVLMARAGRDLLAAADVLVPVPLHPSRLRQRRYNQSALLAAALGLCFRFHVQTEQHAATGDRASLVKLIGQYDHSPAPEIRRQLNSLPKLLSCMIVPHAVEGLAENFESLGATVELRPGWSG